MTGVAIVVDGLIYASWLFIVAIGLTLIFGVMRVLNRLDGARMLSAPIRPPPLLVFTSIGAGRWRVDFC